MQTVKLAQGAIVVFIEVIYRRLTHVSYVFPLMEITLRV